MDRRDFLKTTGAAAVAGSAATASARGADEEAAAQQPAPAALAGTRLLRLAAEPGTVSPGLGPERLAKRIETATGGRYRIEMVSSRADAELTYGCAGRHASLHRAFAFFAGLPFAQGLDAADHHAWLAVGGGEMLLEELAAQFGLKPLIAGHTGASIGVWASARLDSAADLAGATLHVSGLAADVMRTFGAQPVELPPLQLKAALADGRVRAAEWLGPLSAVSPDLGPLAQRVYEPGFQRGGAVLSLDLRKPLWDAMSPADQAVLAACAAQEYSLSLADARAHALVASQVAAPAKWPVRLGLSDGLTDALDRACAEILEAVAASDPEGRRIHDSYQAFRALMHDDVLI